MKNSSKFKQNFKYLEDEEKVFLEILLEALPPQWRTFFESFKSLTPAVLHSFYRLLTYKTKPLFSLNQEIWHQLTEREIKILSRL